jgi:hypothetical protein
MDIVKLREDFKAGKLDLDAAELTIEVKKQINSDYQPLASEIDGDAIASLSMLYDPSAGFTPVDFIAHPPGYKLYWADERLREERGWNQLVPVTFDDPIGRELSRYLPDPPKKFAATQKRDNRVRRGDAVLAAIPIGIWDQRQLRRTEKAARGVEASKNSQPISSNGKSVGRVEGQGISHTPRPRRGFVMPDGDLPADVKAKLAQANK